METGKEFTNSQPLGHQRSKSSVIKSFVHRRQPSKGEALVPEPLSAEIQHVSNHEATMGAGYFNKNNPGALGELQTNQQESAPRVHRPSRDEQREHVRGRSRSPTKAVFSSNPFKPSGNKDASKKSKSREASPSKPKKTKSGTNLAGLLSRPRSLKNLYKTASEEEVSLSKDKENRTPDEPLDLAAPPPIFAQFTSDASVRQQQREGRSSVDARRPASKQDVYMNARPAVKERPKSFQVTPDVQHNLRLLASVADSKARQDELGNEQRSKAFSALTGRGHSRTKSAVVTSPSMENSEPVLDPKAIDKHLEAMLDRRNIPENQRYKMRNLNNTIKMEFIRQDWAEMAAAKADRPGTTDSVNSKEGESAIATASDGEDEKPKRTRGRSFTFSRSKKESSSPAKKSRADGTIGRHLRSKSTESFISDRPSSSSGSSSSNSFFSKIKPQQGPVDYVAYLRKIQKPELVEVGKVHKLRLLLRNETVAWIEEFIQQGGMTEIVGLLNRIMDVEWREEHEDALLHENLLCLKALSTTARAMQHLDSIQADLFPKLLHMIFDPEKKGPSEFTTRNIITSVLFTYIESASPADRVARAKNILGHLRDPAPKEDEKPLAFVLDMRQERPYRVWNKEVVSVTKEVFWIFLHNLNVVALPSDKSATTPTPSSSQHTYMTRHFPQERPPVPAAPYVGGVEWDATNYLTSHLDLVNAVLACTPTPEARNSLRAELRISGWERCMGSSLRLCKEKFYGSVHDALRTWVAAAAEDGWDVRDVRYGPPSGSTKSSPKKAGGGGQKEQKPDEAAPKLDMPRLDFGLENGEAVSTPKGADERWIS